MQALDSPFCAPLYGTYCDDRSVYFLTEALLGGELWYHLKCVSFGWRLTREAVRAALSAR